MTLRVTSLLREYIDTSALINIFLFSHVHYILCNKVKIKRGVIHIIQSIKYRNVHSTYCTRTVNLSIKNLYIIILLHLALQILIANRVGGSISVSSELDTRSTRAESNAHTCNSTTKERGISSGQLGSFLPVSSFQRPPATPSVYDQGVSPQDYSETFLFLLALLLSRHVLDKVTISTRPVASDTYGSR